MNFNSNDGRMHLGNVYWRTSHSNLTIRQKTKDQRISDRKGHWKAFFGGWGSRGMAERKTRR